MPIPAVTLKHNTTHNSQNCGVLIALVAETWPPVTIEPAVGGTGVQPCGFPVRPLAPAPAAEPSDMNTA